MRCNNCRNPCYDCGTLDKIVDVTLLVPMQPARYDPVDDLQPILEHVITASLAQF
jgi:hypothetical protein